MTARAFESLAIVKVGGSIATAAAESDLVNRPLLRRLAGELRAAGRPLVLVHGTGLVGKPWAHREGFALTGIIEATGRATALRIKNELRALDQRIVECLLDCGLPARGMDFESMAFPAPGGGFDLQHAALVELRTLLAEGTVPIFYGDMLRRPDGGYQVVSSDVMMVALARALAADTAIFLTDVDGVLDRDDRTIPVLTPMTLGSAAMRESDQRDVSSGMRGKLVHAFAIAATTRATWIANGQREGAACDLLLGRDTLATRIRVDG